MKNFKFKIGIFTLIFVGLVSIFYFNYRKNKNENRELITVTRGDIIQQVTVTGTTKPTESVNLGFEKIGTLARVYIKIGDKVKIGQLLASTDSRDTLARLSQALASLEGSQASLKQYEAALAVQQSKLEELKTGTRPEEVTIAQAQVDNARSSLADAQTSLQNTRTKADADLSNLYNSVPDILNDAFIKADDAVRKQANDLFVNGDSTNPQLSFQVTDSQIKTDAESLRLKTTTELNNWRTELSLISSATSTADMDKSLNFAKQHMLIIRDFLAKCMDALNSASNLPSGTASANKASVTTGRTNVNAALTLVTNQTQSIISQKISNQDNLSSAQAKVNDANSVLLNAQNQLSLKLAGSTPEAISGQQAQVKQAEANLATQSAQIKKAQAEVLSNQAEFSKTAIRSPINGVVTKQDGKLGAVVSSNTPIISVISLESLEIEANIPEVDISKVSLAEPVSITLDAISGETFTGTVFYIEPAETIIDGVVNYKIKVNFDKIDERIKSGLTANLAIETLHKKDVLKVPLVAILDKDTGKFVRKQTDDGLVEMAIQIGVTGVDGTIEVISGVSEGDKLVNVALKTIQ